MKGSSDGSDQMVADEIARYDHDQVHARFQTNAWKLLRENWPFLCLFDAEVHNLSLDGYTEPPTDSGVERFIEMPLKAIPWCAPHIGKLSSAHMTTVRHLIGGYLSFFKDPLPFSSFAFYLRHNGFTKEDAFDTALFALIVSQFVHKNARLTVFEKFMHWLATMFHPTK